MLDQLIEACGDEFERLTYTKTEKWYAAGNGLGAWASTSEEAVAELWLALNGNS